MQVLQEFYVCVTAKLALPAAQARELVSDLCELRVVAVANEQILRAAEIAPRIKLSFWDALILSAAEAAGASLLLTEDLSRYRLSRRHPLIQPLRRLLAVVESVEDAEVERPPSREAG